MPEAEFSLAQRAIEAKYSDIERSLIEEFVLHHSLYIPTQPNTYQFNQIQTQLRIVIQRQIQISSLEVLFSLDF